MKKAIVTTSWDDNSYENIKMMELLDKFEVRGTFYINSRTDNMGRGLGNKQVKRMVLSIANSHHEVGSHAVSHMPLTRCENPETEIEESKAELEKLIGREVSSFCYPFGMYDEHIKRLVRKAGYRCARTAKYIGIGPPWDPYEWGITLHASNGSPLTSLRIWHGSGISIISLWDWEIRAKLLFDLVLKKGGIWHLWGHSWEIESHNDWTKLARVLKYASDQKNVSYETNGDIFRKL